MKPDKIFYQQSFIHPIYGTYLPTKIGIEVLLNDCDEPDEALQYAKKTVEEWFRKTNLDVIVDSTIPPGPPPIIQSRTDNIEIGVTVDNILSSPNLTILDSYRLIVKGKPELERAYLLRKGQLS